MAQFHVEVGPVGILHADLDGENVTGRVAAVEVAAQDHQPSRIALWFDAQGTIGGDAIAERMPLGGSVETAAELVRGLDPDVMEKAVLHAGDWGKKQGQVWLDEIAKAIEAGK